MSWIFILKLCSAVIDQFRVVTLHSVSFSLLAQLCRVFIKYLHCEGNNASPFQLISHRPHFEVLLPWETQVIFTLIVNRLWLGLQTYWQCFGHHTWFKMRYWFGVEGKSWCELDFEGIRKFIPSVTSRVLFQWISICQALIHKTC